MFTVTVWNGRLLAVPERVVNSVKYANFELHTACLFLPLKNPDEIPFSTAFEWSRLRGRSTRTDLSCGTSLNSGRLRSANVSPALGWTERQTVALCRTSPILFSKDVDCSALPVIDSRYAICSGPKKASTPNSWNNLRFSVTHKTPIISCILLVTLNYNNARCNMAPVVLTNSTDEEASFTPVYRRKYKSTDKNAINCYPAADDRCLMIILHCRQSSTFTLNENFLRILYFMKNAYVIVSHELA